MAELKYEDVKRATQDAVRNLQDMVGEMRAGRDDIRRNIQQLDSVSNRLSLVQAQMNGVQQQFDVQTNVVRTLQAAMQSMQSWQQIINDMSRRIANIEQLVHISYQGVSALHQHAQALHQTNSSQKR